MGRSTAFLGRVFSPSVASGMKNRRRRDGRQESTIWTPYSTASVPACQELRLLLALGVSALPLCVFSSSCGFLSLQPKEPFGMMMPSSGTLVQSLFCISQGLKFRFNVLTQGRENTGINIGKAETKLLFFVSNVIYLENPREPIHSPSY